ncbi:lipocalin family protein [Nocardia sp. alder85J]|uniref:lipocalin family protein n=1 Tax=Nocardia sp. alder85J TaxID=2862949 RepID=UPI001CD5F15A|nr:lipocalin family protein [Nocardia sp. alder85J]MCX4099194.1 lipocalin family protein [Nocardia sp. alder85J]
MVFVALAGGAATARAAGPAPVAQLELDRYLGTWYQLAAVPMPFNLNCARDTRAEYTPAADGVVGVHNSCTTWSGGQDRIDGTATVTDPETTAQFHVAFPGVPGQDQPDGPTNYIVTGLDPDYAWAVVTDPSAQSGFVLSRSPALEPAQWDSVRAVIVAAGQDQCRYLVAPTTGGLPDPMPLCRL